MDFTQLWVEQQDFIQHIRSNLLTKLKQSKSELGLGQVELAHIAELLSDDALLLRFSNKAKFVDASQVEGSLLAHIDWRLEQDLPRRDLKALSETANEYFEKGLLRFYQQDTHNRPLVILDMRHYSKKPTSTTEDLRSYLIFFMDVARRFLLYTNQQQKTGCVGQIAILLDLQYVQVSNLSFDMLPTLYDLFHHHFPQIIGIVYLLNYGWIHAGVWSILKTALPESATRKMVFLNKQQVSDYIPIQDLPKGNLIVTFDERLDYGGFNDREWSPFECPVFHQFAFMNAESWNGLCKKQVYVDLCGSQPKSSGRRSPVKFAISHFDSDRDSDLDEWFDADEEFSEDVLSTVPWASSMLHSSCLYHEVSIDEQEGNLSSRSMIHLNEFPDKVRPVKSASDLQQLLRVPSNRELSGLQPLPRAPSSKTLSSLVMTPLHPISSSSSKTQSEHEKSPSERDSRRRKLSEAVGTPVPKKSKKKSLGGWIVRMTSYLFGIPRPFPVPPSNTPIQKPSFSNFIPYGWSGGTLLVLVAVSFTWVYWTRRGLGRPMAILSRVWSTLNTQ